MTKMILKHDAFDFKKDVQKEILAVPQIETVPFVQVARVLEEAYTKKQLFCCVGVRGCGKTYVFQSYSDSPSVLYFNAAFLSRDSFMEDILRYVGAVDIPEAIGKMGREEVVLVIDDAHLLDPRLVPLVSVLQDNRIGFVLSGPPGLLRFLAEHREFASRAVVRKVTGIGREDVERTVGKLFGGVPARVVDIIAMVSIPSMRRLVLLVREIYRLMVSRRMESFTIEMVREAQQAILMEEKNDPEFPQGS
jgi:hypothetical protein